MISCGVKDSAIHAFYGRSAFMRLYRRDNTYREYRESRYTRACRTSKEGQANSEEAEERERKEEMGKTGHCILIFWVKRRSYEFVQ